MVLLGIGFIIIWVSLTVQFWSAGKGLFEAGLIGFIIAAVVAAIAAFVFKAFLFIAIPVAIFFGIKRLLGKNKDK
ncbi:MAG: hypothetical protein ACI39Q_07705 [Wujia sp.]